MCSFQTNGSSLDYCITDLGDKYCQNTRMALTLITNKSIPKIAVKEIFFFSPLQICLWWSPKNICIGSNSYFDVGWISQRNEN